jgi:hypothetical protein
MKTFTTLAAAAALIAGISIASAQNAGGPAQIGASPSNINKGAATGTTGEQSGNEAGSTAMQHGHATQATNAMGKGKFCIEETKGGPVECKYASITACEKDAQPQGLACSPNPNTGTTGSK